MPSPRNSAYNCPGCAGRLRYTGVARIYFWVCPYCMTFWEIDGDGQLFHAGDLVRLPRHKGGNGAGNAIQRVPDQDLVQVTPCPAPAIAETRLVRNDCMSYRLCENQTLGTTDCRACPKYRPALGRA